MRRALSEKSVATATQSRVSELSVQTRAPTATLKDNCVALTIAAIFKSGMHHCDPAANTKMHKLTHFRLCPLSRSIRLVLNEHQIAYQLDERRAWEGDRDFLELNPAGELPVLELENGPTLCGTYSIAEYINEYVSDRLANTAAISLFPGGIANRAEVRRLTDWFQRKLYWEVTHELLTDKIHPLVSRTVQSSPPDAARLRAVRRNLDYHLSYINHLAEQRSWLGGNVASFADIAAASQLSTIDYMGEIDWPKYSEAKLWYVRIKSRPSFRSLLQDRLVGPEPPKHYSELDF